VLLPAKKDPEVRLEEPEEEGYERVAAAEADDRALGDEEAPFRAVVSMSAQAKGVLSGLDLKVDGVAGADGPGNVAVDADGPGLASPSEVA
jgi:hypothetical protein